MNTPTKTTFFLVLLILYMTNLAHAAFNFESTAPKIEGNTIIDHSNFTYSSDSDGVYKIDYGNGEFTYFGFALSGTVNSNNFVKYTSDYSWTQSVTQTGDNIDVSAKNNDSNWNTNFSFTPYDTKITNTLTNTLPVAITNAKFYYVFTVNQGDIILYNNENYTIPSTPNTHISGNLNNNLPSIKINNKLLFDFEDIIINGFTVTDIYLDSGTNLGLTYSGNVAAIGFTKNNGVFTAGATVVIDPTLTNGDFESGAGSWSFAGNGTFSVVSPGYAGTNMGRVALTTGGTVDQLYQSGFTLEPNAPYRFSVVANSTYGSNIGFSIFKHTSPYTNYGLNRINVNLTTTMTEYVFYFTTTGFAGNTTDVRLQLYIGAYGQDYENYYFDSIVLEKLYLVPSPTSLTATQGNFWINHTWSAGAGNVTDSYNVSVNGTWSNGSTNTYYNNSGLPAHGWSNISVYAFNSTGYTNLSTSVSSNTQLSNNPISINNISDTYTVSIGSEIAIYPTSSDLDSDTPTFDNTTTNGTFYTNNGTFIWTPQEGDSGTYDWQINVTDGYGSSAYKNFSVSVDSTTPGQPLNLTASSGNFWINHTWNTSVNTDSFNVSVNGTWSNGSANTYYNNSGLLAHGWSNITVYGYNTSSSTLGNDISSNTQLLNNAPTFSTSISSAAINTGQSVTITSNITDLDSDVLSNVTVGITFALSGNEINYSMTQDGANWSYAYTAGTTGTYSISHIYANDSYTNASTATVLTFEVSQAVGGGGGGAGGSSVTTYISPQKNATSTFTKLNLTLTNLTDGARPVSDVEAINNCLTNNLFLSGECSDATIITITEKSNWYVLFGAWIGAFFALWTLTLQNQKRRSFVYDPVIYAIVTIVTSLIISLAGVNVMFLGNYLFNNSLSAYTFFTLMLYGFIVTYIFDEVTVKKTWKITKIPI